MLPASTTAELLEKAWALPVARLYSPLLSQSWRAICGPTSVANVLRSMGVSCTRNPLRGFGVRPMSLDQIVSESAEVLPAGWSVRAVRPSTTDAFRAELAGLNDVRRRYVCNFSRAPLFGRGGGHHSPLGGWLEEEELVFVLDVNAGFGPWLVRPERLFEAMNTSAGGGSMRGLARYELQ